MSKINRLLECLNRVERGVELSNLGKYEEAIASYDRALQIKPDDPEAWCAQGITLLKLGRNEEALISFNKALEIKPDYSDALNGRSYALRQLGKYRLIRDD